MKSRIGFNAIRRRGIDPRQREYDDVPTIKTAYVLANDGSLVEVPVMKNTKVLRPGCGRWLYKQAKAAARG